MKLKLFYIFFFFFFLCFQKAYCQEYSQNIFFADSLFLSKNFSDALRIYEEEFNSGATYPPGMLVKMAYINEKFKDYTSALYYLNLYFKKNPGTDVLKKMEDLAYQYRLKGYEYSDMDFFIFLFREYYYYIISTLLFFSILIFLYILSKRRQKINLGPRPIALFLAIGITLLVLNYDISPEQAIVKQKGAYLMSAPSSGSELVAIIQNGHKINILGKEDVWYKIKWEGQIVYIKENNLLLLNL